jgi:hypothetical protein
MTLREFLDTWYGAGIAALIIILAASAANGLMQGRLF